MLLYTRTYFEQIWYKCRFTVADCYMATFLDSKSSSFDKFCIFSCNLLMRIIFSHHPLTRIPLFVILWWKLCIFSDFLTKISFEILWWKLQRFLQSFDKISVSSVVVFFTKFALFFCCILIFFLEFSSGGNWNISVSQPLSP